jgi:hypothetical protein
VPHVFSFQSPSATNSFAPTKRVQIDQTVEGKVEVLSNFESQRHRAYKDPDLEPSPGTWLDKCRPVVFVKPFEVVRAADRSTPWRLWATVTSSGP